MKSCIKFFQYFLLICFFYVFSYLTFTLFSMAEYVDLYCIPILLLLFIAIYWLIIGIISPKNLPFFKTESRLLVIVSSILFVFLLFGTMCVVEVKFYKRPSLQNIALNVYKVFAITKQINPLEQRYKRVLIKG